MKKTAVCIVSIFFFVALAQAKETTIIEKTSDGKTQTVTVDSNNDGSKTTIKTNDGKENSHTSGDPDHDKAVKEAKEDIKKTDGEVIKETTK